jgi:hypothetical protein
VYVRKKIVKIQNRIPDNLTRPVVSDVPAAIDLVVFGLLGSEVVFIQKQMVGLTAFAKRIYMRVLAKEQKIWGQLLVSRFQAPVLGLNSNRLRKNFLLTIPGLLVIDEAEVPEAYFFIDQGIHLKKFKNFLG